MFDQWKSPLDFVDGALTDHSSYPQANDQLSADQYSIENIFDYNPRVLPSFLLLPMPTMKPSDVDSTPGSANANQAVAPSPAFTSDTTCHQPFDPSYQPLASAEIHHYSPVSSPNGSCSDLFGASQPQLIYSSNNADNSEAISDVGCSTPIQSNHIGLLPDHYSKPSEKYFSSHAQSQVVVIPDKVATNPSLPDFYGLSQSKVSLYSNQIFPATGSTAVSPVSLMNEIFPVESNEYLNQKHQNYDAFSRTWANDLDHLHRNAGQFDTIQPSASHSRDDDSNKRHDHVKIVPITKYKRFPCPECGQRFARAFNLQTHIATHAGMRPFSCPADGCSKAFSRRHDLGRHVGAVHREWLALKNLSVQEAVKPLRWKNDGSWGQNHKACRNNAKRQKST
ncbi:hypothetical protein PCASD_06948 [Puccinia coronata f. sp. avenae]|uniref:C2H2-type domain-containing protein n=1 Tax=Puccinia coronata f. sp. avenae TaxID=200324 RepID=A0A2N5SGY5_9BASI|nr:hypothetical protein PCASD_23371 [Puccinia coronata f. sp. avenae]PLW45037.1 hypothetical protein PCASD_06948 [Puccinia coronata f. sp. avenae]